MDSSDIISKAMASPVTWRWIKSWNGKEAVKTRLEDAARKVYQTDAVVRSMYDYSVATGLIVAAMRDISFTNIPEVKAAAIAQNNLYQLHTEAVWIHHLDFDFVREAWTPILDPLST